MSDGIIKFTAQVSKVQTMADGGLRVILDFQETAIDTAAALMRVKQAGGVLEIAAVAIISPPIATEQKQNDRPNPRHHSPYAKTKA